MFLPSSFCLLNVRERKIHPRPQLLAIGQLVRRVDPRHNERCIASFLVNASKRTDAHPRFTLTAEYDDLHRLHV